MCRYEAICMEVDKAISEVMALNDKIGQMIEEIENGGVLTKQRPEVLCLRVNST